MLSGWEKTPAGVAELIGEFSTLANVLTRFCREHGLFPMKFYHGLPEWHLRFARKVGGRAQIEVAAARRDHGVVFHVRGMWFLDDIVTRKRYVRTLRPDLLYVRTDPLDKLKEALTEALAAIDAWALESWDTVLGPFDEWRGLTQDQLSGSSKYYPLRS